MLFYNIDTYQNKLNIFESSEISLESNSEISNLYP